MERHFSQVAGFLLCLLLSLHKAMVRSSLNEPCPGSPAGRHTSSQSPPLLLYLHSRSLCTVSASSNNRLSSGSFVADFSSHLDFSSFKTEHGSRVLFSAKAHECHILFATKLFERGFPWSYSRPLLLMYKA